MPMSWTIFISDLHLQANEPHIAEIFLDFLHHEARKADALYILGDLFEAWIGDDDLSPFNLQIIQALKQATLSGLPIYFMRGNRDFLIGKRFIEKSGVKLLADPTLINLYGTPTLLMHGDSLCTLDQKHQKWRQMTLNPTYQKLALLLPLSLRLSIARWLRKQSGQHQRNLADYITDVNPEAVAQAMQAHQVARLIHGHTHRPAIHSLPTGQRIVLGAWHHAGNALYCNESVCELKNL